MTGSGRLAIRAHEDGDLFREAVNFTATTTAFAARLIEKDYFCSLLLNHLAQVEPALVFKGGTCLAKVHSGFYRLSEDIDLVIPVRESTGRARRSRLVGGLKEALVSLELDMPAFRVVAGLQGSNASTQYVANVEYIAPGQSRPDSIKIEVALREPLLTPVLAGVAQTLLLDPVTGGILVPGVAIPCISWLEAMAEKFRAAMSRREVAVRDFYDIDFAVQRRGLDPTRGDLLELVRRKLAMPGNGPVDVSVERLSQLRTQLMAQLRPVLRSVDFAAFDLDRAAAVVADVARAAGSG